MADLSDIAQDVDIVGPSGNRADVTGDNDLQVTLDGESVDTELPAAGVLSDAMTNPTTPLIGSLIMGFNGTTWDRVRSIATGSVTFTSQEGLVVTSALFASNTGGTAQGRVMQGGDDSDGEATDNEARLYTKSRLYNYNGTTWDRLKGDTTDGILVNLGANNDVTTSHSVTGIGHGVKTVATAGTDEALAGSTACKRVTIQAQTDNTGIIAVGASGVDATVATGTGVTLNPGDVFELDIDNLASVYIDSTVNGEGVRYTYFT